MTDEEIVLKSALAVMTSRFDQFISACTDEQGKPKAPSMRDFMSARGYLPPKCANALTKKP